MATQYKNYLEYTRRLSKKTFMLMILSTGVRVEDVADCDFCPVSQSPKRIVLQLKHTVKNYSPRNKKVQILSMTSFKDPCLCPVTHLNKYLEMMVPHSL